MSKRGMSHLLIFFAVAAVGVASMVLFVNTQSLAGSAITSGHGYNSPLYGGYDDPFYVYTQGQRDVDYKSCRTACFDFGGDRYAPYRYETQKCLNECAYWANTPAWQYQQGPSYWNNFGISPDTKQQGAITGYFAVPTANKYGGEIKGIMDTDSRAFAGRAIETEQFSCFACSCGNNYSTPDKTAAENACADTCGGKITSQTSQSC